MTITTSKTGVARKAGGALGALVVAAMTAASVPAGAQTFERALAMAYENNPDLNAARAELRRIDEGVPTALAGYRPHISVGASATRSRRETNTNFGDNTEYGSPRSVDLTINQPIFRGFRTENGVEAAESAVLAERQRLRSAEQQVLLAAGVAYLNVLRDEAVLELNINNQSVLARQLSAIRDRFEVGELTRTDVSQAQARYAQSTADRIQAESNLRSSQAEFVRVVGVLPKRLRYPKYLSNLPKTQQEAVRFAVVNHPLVLAAQHDEKTARYNVEIAKGVLLPQVDLQGRVSKEWNGLSGSRNDADMESATVSAVVNIPIWQGGGAYAGLRQSKQAFARSQYLAEAVRRRQIELSSKAWQRVDTARFQIQAFNAVVEAARVALEGVRRESEVGSRTVLDVLDAEQDHLDAKVNLVIAERNRLMAALELREAVGTLTADTLGLKVNYYDAEGYYNKVRDKWFGADVSTDNGDYVLPPK